MMGRAAQPRTCRWKKLNKLRLAYRAVVRGRALIFFATVEASGRQPEYGTDIKRKRQSNFSTDPLHLSAE